MAGNSEFVQNRNKIFGGLTFENNSVVTYFNENSGSDSKDAIRLDFNIPYDLNSNKSFDANLLISKIDEIAKVMSTVTYNHGQYYKYNDRQSNFKSDMEEIDVSASFEYIYHDYDNNRDYDDKFKKARDNAETKLDKAFNNVLSDENRVFLEEKDFVEAIADEIKKENLKTIKLYLDVDKENNIEPCVMDSNGNVANLDRDIINRSEKIEIMSGANKFNEFVKNNHINTDKVIEYRGTEYTFDSINEVLKLGEKDRLANRLRSPRFEGSMEELVDKSGNNEVKVTKPKKTRTAKKKESKVNEMDGRS